MFSLHDFLMQGLLDAVGKMADYQIILNAIGWQEKGVLNDVDLATIQKAIEDKNYVPPIEEMPMEEIDAKN